MCGCEHNYSLVSLVQWYKTVTATLPNPSESRQDQEEGSELDSHEEVSLSLTGPGEIKRREVVLDPQVSPEEIKSREVELGS